MGRLSQVPALSACAIALQQADMQLEIMYGVKLLDVRVSIVLKCVLYVKANPRCMGTRKHLLAARDGKPLSPESFSSPSAATSPAVEAALLALKIYETIGFLHPWWQTVLLLTSGISGCQALITVTRSRRGLV